MSLEAVQRARAARAWVHAAACPRPMDGPAPCLACPPLPGIHAALQVLDAAPLDARAARRAIHDLVCQSGSCVADPGSDHADRTQSKPVAALRQYRAREQRGYR